MTDGWNEHIAETYPIKTTIRMSPDVAIDLMCSYQAMQQGDPQALDMVVRFALSALKLVENALDACATGVRNPEAIFTWG